MHMLRVGRNFATLLSLARKSRFERESERESEIRRLKTRHEEWMRGVFGECVRHQKVNIHVLQEIMYQGAVLLVDDGNDDNGNGNGNGN
mmetsp:Transcript_4125/g.8912  ORF Transcript_4125/g.8912 Transcript_4125/m.8912 type:complete len:89 (-) Transcript_4125:11-277(-)